MRTGYAVVGRTRCDLVDPGRWDDEQWPDQWTVVTVDGKLSAQFEHTLLVTETGVEILTAAVGQPTSFISPTMNARALADKQGPPDAPVAPAP